MKKYLILLLVAGAISCKQKDTTVHGTIERADPALDALIDAGATVELLAEGFKWSEGPQWLESEKALIFSDVPNNVIYKWTEEKGKEVYLKPSGYTGAFSPYSGEEGSNGLTLTNDGKLVLCQHGDRRVSVMDAAVGSPEPKYTILADRYEGKRLNSPNDAVFNSKGVLFFTDPPYGLPKQAEDTTREINFQGVFKTKDGVVSLVSDTITRPNGIALFPGERRLIVANSDPEKAIWYTFDLSEQDSVLSAQVFFDATQESKTEKGLPDGLKIDGQGNVFSSGPGGIWIFDQQGKVLGKIKLPDPTANCAFSGDGKTLYITSSAKLLRVKLKA